jgi:hypothetical protein
LTVLQRCRTPSFFVILVFLTSALAPGAPVAAPAEPGEPSQHANPYTPAEECGACHEAIHHSWSEGRHAGAASGNAFIASLNRAAEQGAERGDCLWCHAPTTLVTGDIALRDPVSREGVTCDFCHTVTDVDLTRPGHPFELDPGDVKRGPFKFSESVGHGTEYSTLHKSSPLLCAACHEYSNAAGVAVLSTYSDWKSGPYPLRGVTCQECHMAPVPGTTVKKGMAAPSLIRVINLHRVVGGSTRSQLDRGLDLKISSMSRSGGSTSLTVAVTNVAAGHPVPGGLSTKSLVLAIAVEMEGGDLRHRREKVYRRELKDDRGRVLSNVPDLFLRAASVGRDNRLQPQETREERFTLPLPQGARAVVARLEYHDASAPGDTPTTLLITEARREVSGR